MNIYAIRRDGYKYQELDLDINDVIDDFPEEVTYRMAHDFSRENIKMSGFWKLYSTGFSEIAGQENQLPDICNWIDATLLLSPKAHRLLKDTLNPFGEFLPIVIESETSQLFNCLTLAEVNEDVSSDAHIEFNEASIGEALTFKAPFQSCQDIYCTERLKCLIEDFELKGVVFDTRLASPFEDD